MNMKYYPKKYTKNWKNFLILFFYVFFKKKYIRIIMVFKYLTYLELFLNLSYDI